MSRRNNGRVARISGTTDEATGASRRASSRRDRREAALKVTLTAVPAVLSFLTGALSLIADISGFSFLAYSTPGFVPVLAGSFAVALVAALVIYFRGVRARKSKTQTSLQLTDIRDPGVRQIITSATREQALLTALLAEVQQSPKLGGVG